MNFQELVFGEAQTSFSTQVLSQRVRLEILVPFTVTPHRILPMLDSGFRLKARTLHQIIPILSQSVSTTAQAIPATTSLNCRVQHYSLLRQLMKASTHVQSLMMKGSCVLYILVSIHVSIRVSHLSNTEYRDMRISYIAINYIFIFLLQNHFNFC